MSTHIYSTTPHAETQQAEHRINPFWLRLVRDPKYNINNARRTAVRRDKEKPTARS